MTTEGGGVGNEVWTLVRPLTDATLRVHRRGEDLLLVKILLRDGLASVNISELDIGGG
jgi:hypothetical protein